MNLLFKVFNWIAAVFFVFLGSACAFGDQVIGGLLFISASLLLLPPARSWMFQKTKIALPPKSRAIAVAVLVVASLMAIGIGAKHDAEAKEAFQANEAAAAQVRAQEVKAQEFSANRDSILSAAKAALAKANFSEVIMLLTPYVALKDPELQQTLLAAKSGIEQDQKKAQLAALQLEADKSKDPSVLADTYSKLAALAPENKKYGEQKARYMKTVQDEKDKAEAAAVRKKKIEAQFSPWDGSHINLERLIKKSMNDPDSYEHDETNYWDLGDHLVVLTQFRGRNAFGGMVRNSVKANVDLNGSIIKVIGQN